MEGKHWVIIAFIAGVVALVALNRPANGKQIIVTELPAKIYCQPFKSEALMAEEERLLKEQGFKVVNYMDVPAAIRSQSEGKGELTTLATRVCGERPGQRDSIVASTYYYRKIK